MFVLVYFHDFIYSSTLKEAPQIVSSRFHKIWIQPWLVATQSVSLRPLSAPSLLTSPMMWLFPGNICSCCWGPGPSASRSQCARSQCARSPLPTNAAPPPATCTWDQLCGPSLTEEPLHLGWPRTDRDRGTNAPSSCFRVQLWRCGLQAGAPLTRPREIPPHTPAPGSLTLCRFFLNQSCASGSGADCIYRLMVFSPPHWSITSRGQELDLSCSLCVSVAWCLAGNNYSNMGWDE